MTAPRFIADRAPTIFTQVLSVTSILFLGFIKESFVPTWN